MLKLIWSYLKTQPKQKCKWPEICVGNPYSWKVACYPWNYQFHWCEERFHGISRMRHILIFQHCASVYALSMVLFPFEALASGSFWLSSIIREQMSAGAETWCIRVHTAKWKVRLSPWDETSLNSASVHVPQKGSCNKCKKHSQTWNDNSENKSLLSKKDLFSLPFILYLWVF